AVGLALALVLGFALERVLAEMLYGVGATDLASFVVVIALLLGTALAASFLPAWRALGIDPMTALRQE
ncbi:MAG: hypothetical protein HC897_08945, partial [Thermoanaerobaculia bacterium]|nr:hypothetical protein [Thermoanaerobaculia bacterium]